MTPQAHQIIREVCTHYDVHPEWIASRRRGCKLPQARIDITRRLHASGCPTARISEIIGRDRTTILYYLGHLQKKTPLTKPRWHRPRIKTLWKARAVTKKERQRIKALIPPRSQQGHYLRPYAGAYMPEYQWRRRA